MHFFQRHNPMKRVALGIVCTLVAATHANALPTATICPPGTAVVSGASAADKLSGSSAADCLVADAGDDRIRAGSGDDFIVPGAGKDRAQGGRGNDTFALYGDCELQRGETFSGGAGRDTVISPFTREQLEARGIRLRSIEVVSVVPNPLAGACVDTGSGIACDCCDLKGFDPAAECTSCLAGLRRDDPRERAGDIARPYERTSCVAQPTCSDLSCGDHGHCAETASGAVCACDNGYAGTSCEACAPPFESTEDGRCILGPVCARALCNGHGVCTSESADAGVHCLCDDGWDRDTSCGGPNILIGGANFIPYGDGAKVYKVKLLNGSACTTDFSWEVARGRGRVRVDPADSQRATYTRPVAARGKVEHVQLRATCANNPAVGATVDVNLGGRPALGEPPVPVRGSCDPALAASFDAAMLSYMADNKIPGGTLAIQYQEQVVCLRAYGYRQLANPADGTAAREMKTCTPMRVASITKPFTRAAFRGHLFGEAIAANLGGGTVGESTPILPILAPTMGLGAGGEVDFQGPAGLYSSTYPPFIMPSLGLPACSTSDGLINSAWSSITINKMLGHVAGFPANNEYRFNLDDPNDNGSCTGEEGEICGDWANVGDPTITAVMQMPNDLHLDHGVVNIDDVTKWMAGICLYDDPNAFPPNGRFRYSNVGFTMAGKMIEALTGSLYEDYLTTFLGQEGISNLAAPGSPWVYQGQSLGDGPKGTNPDADWLREATYYSKLGPQRDVTRPELFPPLGWGFPHLTAAPYGGANFDVMAPHGGLVMNALALAKFGSEYLLFDGTPRDLSRGGPGKNFYYDSQSIQHNGKLFGTWAWALELPPSEPGTPSFIVPNGCLVAGDGELDELTIEACPLPEGIRLSVIFNGEPPLESDPEYTPGRHDFGMLLHTLRRAAAAVGTEAKAWNGLKPLSDLELRKDCDYSCDAQGECKKSSCGDGVVDLFEDCDDGDTDDNDFCHNDCTLNDSTPNGYEDCEGLPPGECLGGPCATISPNPTDSELLNPYSEAHPDGNWARDQFCRDFVEVDEAVCIRTEIFGHKYGVCQECGADTMEGCTCPSLGQEDGGCNMGGMFEGYSCVGGRCWQGEVPNWMCTADCDNDIYGTGGYCYHDDPHGHAVCYNYFCSEPDDHYCSETFNFVCEVNADSCVDTDNDNKPDSCCKPECLDDDDCSEIGYAPGHQCLQSRCRLP